ncbi:MAG: lamin tail domain-containing protein [Candidatus Woesebacteria bacterium]|nr:lamin tail domain-containing protein [Candidatus Woesebacteria bacterium]
MTVGFWSNQTVVINEIMWMGSTVHELDKWIELRNTTNEVIDITGWKLYGVGPGPNEIILNGKIEANGYFLLSHYASIDDKSALNDLLVIDQVDSSLHLTKSPGEQLILKDASGNIIDQTPTGSWVAGTHTSPATVEQSIERNSDPSSGWHTCTNIACSSTKYWDIEGNNYGTPGYTNLSEEDLISSFSTQTVESESSPSPSLTPIPEVSQISTSEPMLEPTFTPTPTPSLLPNPESSLVVLFELFE